MYIGCDESCVIHPDRGHFTEDKLAILLIGQHNTARASRGYNGRPLKYIAEYIAQRGGLLKDLEWVCCV